MLYGVCSAACKPCHPSIDVVKVDMSKLAFAGSAPASEQVSEQPSEQLSEQQHLAAALTTRLEEVRAEREREEAREREQERQESLEAAEAARQAEEQRIREQVRLSQEARKEEARKQREDDAACHRACMDAAVEEKKRLHKEQENFEERTRLVREFLKQHGFAGVNTSKRFLIGSTYPLHKAAELGDARMVAMLMQEGADPKLKTSWGTTAACVAQKYNKACSHVEVVDMLVVAR